MLPKNVYDMYFSVSSVVFPLAWNEDYYGAPSANNEFFLKVFVEAKNTQFHMGVLALDYTDSHL